MQPRLILMAVIAGLLLPGGGAAADQPRVSQHQPALSVIHSIDWQNNHDDPRNAVRAGRVLPLRAVLAKVRQHYPGRMLDASLAQENNPPVYYIKMLMGDGRVVLVSADATNGRIISAIQGGQ